MCLTSPCVAFLLGRLEAGSLPDNTRSNLILLGVAATFIEVQSGSYSAIPAEQKL